LTQGTTMARKETVTRKWYVVDADGVVLGRLAAKVATVLRGKDKPTYTPSVDTGDFVIVVNAEKVRLTGNKETQKVYYRHSGYPGGLRETPYLAMKRLHPERIVEEAVRGMLPKTPLGRQMFMKLKVYGGAEHPHAAQSPEPLEVTR